jgi:hypothetical protein
LGGKEVKGEGREGGRELEREGDRREDQPGSKREGRGNGGRRGEQGITVETKFPPTHHPEYPQNEFPKIYSGKPGKEFFFLRKAREGFE